MYKTNFLFLLSIVKASRSGQNSPRGSPERALLSNETTPMHHRTPNHQDTGSIYTENIDLSSPGFTTTNRNLINDPPRNIFDDIQTEQTPRMARLE